MLRESLALLPWVAIIIPYRIKPQTHMTIDHHFQNVPSFGQWARRARKAQGLTLRALADRAGLGIRFLSEKFNVIAGLSEHSIDNDYAIAAVSLGAKVIEKHFTLSRADGGPDALFSLEPNEMERLVLSVRKIEKAVGTSALGPTETEKKAMVFRKSLFVVKDIKKGDKFSRENVRVIRPAYGLSPKYYFDIIGKRASKDIKRGTPLVFELIEPPREAQS